MVEGYAVSVLGREDVVDGGSDVVVAVPAGKGVLDEFELDEGVTLETFAFGRNELLHPGTGRFRIDFLKRRCYVGL